MADIEGITDYDHVISSGGELSKNMESAGKRVNFKNVHVGKGLVSDGAINLTGETANKIEGIRESIDGVGTKTQIYLNAFELYVQKFEEDGSKEEDKEALIEISTEIFEALFHDLIAMNVDDLREGEMGVIFTNIFDINHVKGIRGEIFAESLPKGMELAAKEIGLAVGGGETAILGESQKFVESLVDFIRLAKKELGKIENRREDRKNKENIKKSLEKKGTIESNSISEKFPLFNENAEEINRLEESIDFSNQDIRDSFETMIEQRKILKERIKKIELNLAGTAEGLIFENKLIEVKPGQLVMALYEKPTKEGIVGSRANGYTNIRELIHNYAGKGWELLTFNEFLKKIREKVGEDKINLLKKTFSDKLGNLPMWKVATGKTTVFNQFISRVLLGGEDKNPIVGVSAIGHITGGPLQKFANTVQDDRYMIKADITNTERPQIIEILQEIATNEVDKMDDHSVMSKFNGGVPIILVIDSNDKKRFLEKARENGFTGEAIGTVEEKDLKNYNRKVVIEGAGKNKTTVEKYDEIDRDMPDLPERYKHTHSGKVRETYENPDNTNELFIIATNRVSTHDVVHNSLIESKGKALTSISNFWFNKLKNNPETSDIKTQVVENPIWPDDFPEELKEKTTIAKKLKALPIEAIVRGYLYGSVLKGYNPVTGELSTGQFVGEGLQKCSKFKEPTFTPSTKGETDININFDNMHEELSPWLKDNGYDTINAKKLAEQVKEMSLQIYKFASDQALKKGDILGDTKFEFGLDKNGNIVLIDEILTPDSSRFWNAETHEELKEPDSSDKQYVRDEVSNIWKNNPRSDSKKYPVKLSKESINNTEIIYAGMNIKYSV